MQNELTALRPQLLETSDETEKLMIKIEQDTIQVMMVTMTMVMVEMKFSCNSSNLNDCES